MKQVWKKRAVAAAVLVFVGAAVYLNWRYSDNVQNQSKVLGQSTLVNAQENDAQSDSDCDAEQCQNHVFPIKIRRQFAVIKTENTQGCQFAPPLKNAYVVQIEQYDECQHSCGND